MIARVVIAVALMLWLAFGDVPAETRVWRAAFDAGHVPLFGALALLLRGLLVGWRPAASGRATAGAAWAGAVAIGIAAEILQTLSASRDASISDVARDAAGAAAFLLAGAAHRSRAVWPRVRLRAALVTAALLLVAATADLSRALAVHRACSRAMPALVRLDGAWWEHDLLELGATTLTPSGSHEDMARLTLHPARYPGLIIDEPYPDWRGFRWLELTIASDLAAPVALSIRVNDAAHDNRYADRFNRQLVIAPGMNHVRIALDDIHHAPDAREMDMTRIRTVILFVYHLHAPIELRIGPITLAR